jgi:signal transduction histidine kinase
MTASVTVAFAVWMLLLCLGFMVYARHTAARQVAGVLNATTETLRRDLTDVSQQDTGEQDHTGGLDAVPAALSDFINEHREDLIANQIAVLLVDAHGQIVQQSQDHVPPWPTTRDDDWKIRTVSAGSSTMVFGYHWGKTEEELRERAFTLLALSLCVVVAAAMGAWVLVGRTLSPIGRLAQQATASSADTLHLQLTAPSQDAEIVELVTTLNGLLARLSETATSKGRFYAAASHELRTPLQALSGHLEVALSRQRSADAYRSTLEEAHTQTERLTVLVRDLLVLNQLDTAMTPPVRETVSIAEICDRALYHCQPLITRHALHLQTALKHDGEILAPPAHAEMLLRNLVENAVKYAAPGGDVQVNLSESPSLITVTIFNSCAPIEHWHAEALFEPFFRLDASRNAKTGGNGLGLAICKAITLANGWKIALEHDGQGVRASVDFPRPLDEM